MTSKSYLANQSKSNNMLAAKEPNALNIEPSCKDGSFNNYLVILKVYGNAIQIGPQDEMEALAKTHTFKIFCQDVDVSNQTQPSGIQVFVLSSDPDNSAISDCHFETQQVPFGQPIQKTDMVTFMSPPISNSKKVNYAIDLSYVKNCTSLRDQKENDGRKLGTAYLYLDPKFSTQGTQRMQVIGSYSLTPIGQIQVEYLIIRNPAAYQVRVPKPSWLSPSYQLDAGHRGAGSGCRADLPGNITENTVASFNYAASHGADMCELDVMCTSDGVPVVYHNYALNTDKADVTQIDQFTLKELQNLTSYGLHDKDCDHKTKQQSTQVEEDCRLFPTLEKVLADVDKSCALNIELKWPQLLPDGKSEATHYREINDYVDRVLKCINDHGNDRHILLSTLNSDIAIMLRLKQTKFPVLFLTTGDSSRFNDVATKTVKNAIHFAQAFDLAGINPNAAYLTEDLVRYAQERGQLVYAWGKIDSARAIRELKRTGLNGVIYDKIDLIKPQDYEV